MAEKTVRHQIVNLILNSLKNEVQAVGNRVFRGKFPNTPRPEDHPYIVVIDGQSTVEEYDDNGDTFIRSYQFPIEIQIHIDEVIDSYYDICSEISASVDNSILNFRTENRDKIRDIILTSESAPPPGSSFAGHNGSASFVYVIEYETSSEKPNSFRSLQ